MCACKPGQIAVRLLWMVLLFLFTAVRLSAAFEELSIAQLRDELKKGLLAEDLIPLRPVLNELSARTQGEPEQEGYVFLLGLSYQDEYSATKQADSLRKAMDFYRQYVDSFPQGTRRAYVRFNLAGAYADLGELDQAIAQYDWLYRRGENAVLRQESRDRMCRLYLQGGKAADGVPLFLEVFNAAVLDEELRAQSAAWLLQGYLAAGNSDAIPPYLRYLTGDTEAVYDPNFNITLLKAGDQLFDAEAYDQAILLYSFVKPKSSIVAFYKLLTSKLRKQLSYLSAESDQHTILSGRLLTAEANLKALESVRDYDVDMRWRVARVYLETERNWEALWSFYYLYQDYPDHPQREDFCYISFSEARASQDSELVARHASEYLSEPDFRRYHSQVTLGLAETYLNDGNETAFVELVEDYLQHGEDNLTAAQLLNKWALLLTSGARYRTLRDRMQPLIAELEGREPAVEAARYWHALAQLLLNDFSAASISFTGIVRDYSQQANLFAADANYRLGIALYGEARNAEAEAQFSQFIERYPESTLRGEAELYLGDLKSARGAKEEAIAHYEQVEVYTDRQEFISKAVFAISEVHLATGQSERAFDVIQAYLDQYGEDAYSAEASYRLGKIRESQGQTAERFRIHAQAIQDLGFDTQRHAVDRIILEYVRDYTAVQESYAASVVLLERLIHEPEFRRSFLADRAYQYAYMQSATGRIVDATLAYVLVRDRAVRQTLIESDTVSSAQSLERLNGLLDDYHAKVEGLVTYDANTLFRELYTRSAANASLIVLELRARMALDALGNQPQDTKKITDADLSGAPPAVLLWQANAQRTSDLERATRLYQLVIQAYPFSDSAQQALESLAQLAFDEAQANPEALAWERALVYYDQLSERMAQTSPSAAALITRAKVLVRLQRAAEAIETLGRVLKNPAWRGLEHAEAHLALGKIYMERQQWQEAHGFFERLIVAYGGYLETVSWAYYYDLKALEALGESESVAQLLAEYQTRVDVLQDTEAYPQIREAYDL